MSTTLLPPGPWAQCEFGFAQLGDQRRNQRLVNIAEHLAGSPGGTLPQAFPDWAELKAAYRFFGQRGVSFERVLAPHLERTRQACRQPGEYLLIEDTTLLDYSRHPHTEELGLIGDGGRGFELHSALAVRIEAWTLAQRPEGMVVGLFDQKSQTWAAGIKTAGRPPAGSQWIYVADRESDFYEPLRICQQHGVELVIRACQDRRLADQAGRLKEALAQTPVRGQTTVAVRGRGNQAARQAVVAIRSVRVDLDGPWRPGGWQAPLRDIGAVEVSEIHPAEGVQEPLHWILLTSLPCSTWSQVQRVVGCYTARWWIEEYHKALKSGTGVEQSQLAQADRLEPLIAVLAVVAVRLLSTKMLARSRPESGEAAASFGVEMAALLAQKLGQPKDGWTNRNLIRSLARLGGFIGRKQDGEPGWQTIWRGWQRLMWMREGVETLQRT
jgi:hypothetical protein